MDIDARPCNMASEVNKMFPRYLLVNVKEVSGIFLIILWWANKLAQMYTHSYTYITSRVKAGLSPSKKFFIICFSESPSKMMKNAFYFILRNLKNSFRSRYI